MPSLTAKNPQLAEFVELVTAGVDLWTDAGRLLAGLVTTYGRDAVFGEIAAKCAGLDHDTLEMFLRIGRKELYPMLVISDSPGAETLVGLPYEDQVRLYREGVAVWDLDGDEWSCYVTPIDRLTPSEVRQVFDHHRARTEAEQKAYVAEQERRREQASAERRRKLAERNAPKQHRHNIGTGSRAGWEPDRPAPARSLEELATMQPLDLLRDALERAQVALIESRRHLAAIRKGSKLDDQITAALLAVGNLRYAANHGEL